MMFPHDLVPDGHIMAPHHLYIGIAVMALALAMMWDDRETDPYLAAASVMGMGFSFTFVWPFYHATGAAMSLAFLALGALAPLIRLDYWSGQEQLRRGVAHTLLYAVGLLVAADDLLEHAFGIWTPLDWLFNAHMIQHLT